MNKKGFTMVELLAVIVILGILLTITTVSVFNINKSQEEQNRQNTISSILTAAKSYTADYPNLKSKNTKIYVKTLVEQGYVEFDKDEEISKGKNNDDLFVTIVECQEFGDSSFDDASIKVTYVLEGFNDCGCVDQQNNENKISDRLCN